MHHRITNYQTSGIGMRVSLRGSLRFCLFCNITGQKELCMCTSDDDVWNQIILDHPNHRNHVTPSKQRTFSDGSRSCDKGKVTKDRQYLSQPVPCWALILTLLGFVYIQSVRLTFTEGLGFHFILFQAQGPTLEQPGAQFLWTSLPKSNQFPMVYFNSIKVLGLTVCSALIGVLSQLSLLPLPLLKLLLFLEALTSLTMVQINPIASVDSGWVSSYLLNVHHRFVIISNLSHCLSREVLLRAFCQPHNMLHCNYQYI